MSDLIENDLLSSEFFFIEIKSVDARNGKIWDDSGSRAEKHVAFWRVDPSPDFFALGHCATNFHEINNETGHFAPVTITLKPKPGHEDLLAEPIDYEIIWRDEGSGLEHDCSIWRPVCPEGYSALGDVVTNGRKPTESDLIRCVKDTVYTSSGRVVDLVAPADYIDFGESGNPQPLWTEQGSSVKKAVSIWLMRVSGRPSVRNQVHLVAGTFRTGKYHEHRPIANAKALALYFPQPDIMEKVEMGGMKLKLTSAALPSDEELKASASTNRYQVPFFAVSDPMYKSQIQQFLESPVYTIERFTRYEAIDGFEPINTETKEFSVTVGTTHETSYSNEAGVTLGVAVEIGGEAGIAVGKTSVKVTASVEASYSHSWGGATSEYEERSFVYPQTVTGGCFGALFQARSTYTIYRKNGTPVGAPVEVRTHQFYTDEWRPAHMNLASASKDGQSNAGSANTITFTIDAPPGKVIILEGRLEIRDGQLISTPTVVKLPSDDGASKAVQEITIKESTSTPEAIGKAPTNQTSKLPSALENRVMQFDDKSPPKTTSGQLTPSYTKEVWMRGVKGNSSLLRNIVSGGKNAQHAFIVQSDKVGAGHNGEWSQVTSDTLISEDWEHYAVTYDNDLKKMKLYRNGNLVCERSNVQPFAGAKTIQVGSMNTPAEYHLIGELAEVRVWNRALSQEQIASQMSLSLPATASGLTARFPD